MSRIVRRDGHLPQELVQTQMGEHRCRGCGRAVRFQSSFPLVSDYMPTLTKEQWLRNPICALCAKNIAVARHVGR